MAAIFPLDTTQPWTFNGVTYQYDAAEDRWFVISTNKTDLVDDSLETLNRDVDIINTTIDQEIENRTALLNQAAAKNNEQDTRLDEIDARLELVADNIGVLDFAGLFEYMPLITEDTCNAQFAECVAAAAGDSEALQACTQEQARCMANITTEVPDGKFVSDEHVYANVNYLRISNKTINDATYDWVSLIEPGDYIELVEQNLRDTVLYEVLTDARADAENIRVQFVRQTNLGDSEFNDGELYAIRVFKEERGLDLNQGDARYVQRPYTVMFSDDPPELGQAFTGVLKNGELWYDTQNLEMFVWNNNAWVAAAKPPSQDVTVLTMQQDIDKLSEEAFVTNQTLNTLVSESLLENNIYYSDEAPSGDVTGTLRNGDIWVDSDDLTIKFYSGGAWINPDRQVGGDYVEKSGSNITGYLDFTEPKGKSGVRLFRDSDKYFSLWNGFQTNETRARIEPDKTFKLTGYRTGNSTETLLAYWNPSIGLEVKELIDPTNDSMPVTLGYAKANFGSALAPPGRKFKKQDAIVPTEVGRFTYYEESGQLKIGLNRRDAEEVKWLDIDINDTLAAPVLFRIVQWQSDELHHTVRYGAVDKIVASDGGHIVCDVRYHKTNGSMTNGANYYITIGGLI